MDGVALGPDHRDLGLAQELVGRRPDRVGEGDAHRRADEPLASVERERRAQLGADPVGDVAGLVGVADRVEDDPELVAAEARDRVARPQAVDQPLADGQRAADRRRCGRGSR